MSDYKWSHPAEWLDDHCAEADIIELRSVIRDLMSKVDGDDLQDLFQAEMDADWYFKPVRKGSSE